MKNNQSEIEYLKANYFKRPDYYTLKEMLYDVSEKYSNKTAFRIKNENKEIINITYSEYKKDVEDIGNSLIKNGYKNKKIAIIGKNSYKWAITYLAASIVGIVVPIDKELHTEDIINFLNISESKVILGDSKNLKGIIDEKEKLNSPISYISFDSEKQDNSFITFEEFKNDHDESKNEFEKIEINPNEMHFLLFTSGTTGNAKGVCLSHRNICSNITSVGNIVKVSTKTSIMSILPIHHTYECTLGYLLVTSSGGQIAYCDGLRYIPQNLNEYKPNIILSVPLLLENVHKKIMKTLKQSLPEKYFVEDKHIMDTLPFYLKIIVKKKILKSLGGNLTKIIVGAAPLNPYLVDSFGKFGITVLSGYGLTECSPLVAGNNDFFHKADSCGLPIPNVEFKIDNPNSEGVGEIITKGPNVMLGYYKNDQETNKVLKDGWFHTGDLGKIDKKGYLYITGRCKNLIIAKDGKNVYPEELETLLDKEDFILESLVSGRLDEQTKETYVKAQIKPNLDAIKEYLGKEQPTQEEIFNLIDKSVKNVNEKIPNFKHIREFKIRDNEFEKTTTQKIKRYGKNLD
ncbi:MAG: AMP-binding protein [Clostridia bacterium]|nr:AMP-binding protein [Clostridia bacterium]